MQRVYSGTTMNKRRFCLIILDGAIHNPRHVKPETRQTPDTSNLRRIKPQTHQTSDTSKNIGLPTTQQMKIPLIFRSENPIDFQVFK